MSNLSQGIITEMLGVVCQAAKLGRTDIIQHSIASLRKTSSVSDEELADILSIGNDEGATPLHIASYYNHTDVNLGADPTIVASGGVFVDKRPYEVAQENTQRAYHVYLFEQIAMNKTDNIMRLINGGLPVSLTDESKLNDSTLHWACSFNAIDAVKLLLRLGVDVDIVNNNMQTSLHLACKACNKVIIGLLLDAGANTTLIDVHHHTPLALLPANNKDLQDIFEKHRAPGMNGSGAVKHAQPRDSYLPEPSNGPIVPPPLTFPTPSALPQLLLWPPPQYQQVTDAKCVITNAQPLLLCCNSSTDIFSILNWSKLIDCLDKVGFVLQVKRTLLQSVIHFVVDNNICHGVQRYELTINTKMIKIIASDETGLLYGIYTLIQIISMHAEIATEHGVKTMTLPCLKIVDYGDVLSRGVYYTFRSACRTSSNGMKSMLSLLSQLRINDMFLCIDTCSPDHSNVEHSASVKICALDELCRRYGINLIPAVVINSKEQRLLPEIIRNFSSSRFLLIFDPQLPLSQDSFYGDDVHSILSTLCQCGVTSVTVSCTEEFQDLYAPVEVAMLLGLNAVHMPVSQFQSSLLNRPFTTLKPQVNDMLTNVFDVISSGETSCIMPALCDSDFMYPQLLIKYLCFFYGGACWNMRSVTTVAEEDDYGVLQKVLQYVIHSTDNIADSCIYNTLVSSNFSDNLKLSMSAIADIESALWSLINCSSCSADMILPVSKHDATIYYKYIRHVINNTNWKFNKSETSEEDEYMSMVYLLSIWCKAIVLAYNISEAEMNLTTFLGQLSPGSASDIANVLIEILRQCTHIWKKRFETFHVAPVEQALDHITDAAVLGKARFLHVSRPDVPVLAMFHRLCANLPMYSDEVICSIFNDAAEAKSTLWFPWKK